MPVLKQLNERDPVLPVMVDDFVPASERCVNFTHSITAIIQQVESQTGAVQKILDGTDLEVSMLARHTTRTSCQHLEKVVRNTLNLMQDTDVALRAGRRMRVTSYGMYGYALLSSANFIDVSMVNNKYILSGSPFCQAPMILQGNGGYCTLTPRQWTDPADMAYRFSVEFALAAHLSVCRDVTGGRFGFSRVELAYPRPVYGDAYEQVLAMLVAAISAPLLTRRFPVGRVVTGALLFSVLGYLMLAWVDAEARTIQVVSGFALIYLGLGAIAALGTDLVVAAAPTGKAGSAASLSETVQELGVALGVAILGSLSGSLYRICAAEQLGALSTAVNESLWQAVSVADQLPAGVLKQAREIFTQSLNLTALITAVGIGLLAMVPVITLRGGH